MKPEEAFPGLRVVLRQFKPGTLEPFNAPSVVECAKVCHLRMALHLATKCALLEGGEVEKLDSYANKSFMEVYVEMEKIGERRGFEAERRG